MWKSWSPRKRTFFNPLGILIDVEDGHVGLPWPPDKMIARHQVWN